MAQLVREKNGALVDVGDELITNRGEVLILEGFEEPTHEGSTGRVHVKSKEHGWRASYFPSVVGCKIVGG